MSTGLLDNFAAAVQKRPRVAAGLLIAGIVPLIGPRVLRALQGPSLVYPLNAEAAEALPAPVNFTSSSLIPALLTRFAALPTSDGSWVFPTWVMIALAVVSAIIVGYLATRWGSKRWIALAMALAIPAAPFVAWTDPYSWSLVLGLVWVGLSRTWPHAVAGAVLASLGHSEQALAALFALWVVTRAHELRPWRTRSNTALVMSLVIYGLFQSWFLLSGFHDVRTLNLGVLARESLAKHLNGEWPTLIFSLYGVLWVVLIVLTIGVRPSRWSGAVLWLGLAAIPLAAGFLTLDGTRVLVPVGTPASMAVLSLLWDRPDRPAVNTYGWLRSLVSSPSSKLQP